ncbi:MAG: hypothetical protein KBH45_06940 [Verrucomicrobia bacterium]|nr:hypothetical protein [Verrucomicrobiota bacterium]
MIAGKTSCSLQARDLKITALTLKISLNESCLSGIHDGVRYFRNVFFALAAFLWLPVSAHCQLERVPGLEFLACLTESDCHNEQRSDRNDNGCCLVEKSEYKLNQTRLTLPTPDFILLSLSPVLDFANVFPAEVSASILTTAPPEFPKCWQFLSRTALPVRAP